MNETHPLERFAWLPMAAGLVAALALTFQAIEVTPFPMSRVMAPLFIGFGLFKIGLAVSLVLTMRQGGAQAETLMQEHGDRRGVRGWMNYKFAAGIVAILAGCWAAFA